MAEIMIIDDDTYISDMLCEALQGEGYSVSRAYSGTEAIMLLSVRKPDLILLDLMLPGLSGEKLIKRINDIPVIVVSAKAATSDKVELLLGGAADYITKPFDINELLARITVQLRKSRSVSEGVIKCGKIQLDTDSHTVKYSDKDIKLTRTEYAILKLLMQNEGQVVAKLTILDKISDDTPDCTEDSLKIHVHNLRKKLKAVSDTDYISAIWGIGFMLKC
jgi:DNA-binding response OmpR family regulator